MEEGVDPEFLKTQRRLQEEARERNRSEFGEEGEAARLRLEGFRAGLYVRLVLKKVPVEFVKVRTVCYCYYYCCRSDSYDFILDKIFNSMKRMKCMK
jgi:hypothetical protein